MEGATIGLYYLGTYLASSKVAGGVATFTFPSIGNLDTVFITATKQNYTPYFGYAQVVNFPNNYNQYEKDDALLLYPNPSIDFAILQTKPDEPIKKIQLFDIKGVLIFEEKINHSFYKLNTKIYPKGNYLLKISTTDNSLFRKLRIE